MVTELSTQGTRPCEHTEPVSINSNMSCQIAQMIEIKKLSEDGVAPLATLLETNGTLLGYLKQMNSRNLRQIQTPTNPSIPIQGLSSIYS